MKKMNEFILFLSLLMMVGCSDYLDVVPDNVATINHAFNNRTNAEKYLFTCYSYLPNPTSPNLNQALMSGNECWMSMVGDIWYFWGGTEAFDIARGLQNTNRPLLNYWDGDKGATNLFVALRDCNIFLENIDKPGDLEPYERDRWIAEVKFLKAYYHFYLLRTYGPIPIIDKNILVSSTPEEVKVYREPVDEVADYIVSLLDESLEHLPATIQNQTQEMGRITRPIALAIKAKVLTLVASPIFNGNPYYAHVKDKRGIALFSETYNVAKWTRAATAIKEAIDCAHTAGSKLYYYQGHLPITDSTRKILNIANAVTERWNTEIIWGSTHDDTHLQKVSCTRTSPDQSANGQVVCMMSPTLDIAEQFYSNNGVPITEDTSWDYGKRYETSEAGIDHRYYIKPGYTTANLHFNREPRFYASLTFDGCALFGNGIIDDNSSNLSYAYMKKGQVGGVQGLERYSITGYRPKKLVSFESVIEKNSFTTKRYSFPIVRLSDLYLMLAEALNEMKAMPDKETYQWIDLVRERASLKGVVESWRNYSDNPGKPATQAGMREIIQQERLIELAFEGERYWDLLRWKKAEIYMNKPIRGWTVMGETEGEFYKVKEIAQPEFYTKHYLFPLRKSSLDINSNLIQNPGW